MAWLEKRSMLVGAAAAALVGGALVPAFALAQSSGDETPAPAQWASHGVRLRGEALAEVASMLGVDEETLRAAVDSVREALRPAERPAVPPAEEEREAKRAEFQAALAAELGVTAEQVDAAFEAAKPTEEEIAAARAERLAEAAERLAEAVAEGRLTQEEADTILDRIESGEGPGRGFGPGGRGHHGPFGGGPHGGDGGTGSASGDASGV